MSRIQITSEEVHKEQDECHSFECGCWMCDGREPDAQYIPYFEGYIDEYNGICANCGQSLFRGESTVHSGLCSTEFAAYLNSSLKAEYEDYY